MLGSIRLRDDQRFIAARAQRLLDRHGGCLIAEDVGRGKTFIALALAKRWRNPLVIAPAALRSTWLRAAASSGIPCAVHSHDALSRKKLPSALFDGLIVDESHHFRTTSTVRYAALAELAVHAPIVLLSATPLQNRARDLAAQLALFIGSGAYSREPTQLARYVLRGEPGAIAGMPEVLTPEWRGDSGSDQHVLDALLALPTPPAPEDGGDAGALRQLLLVRAWASSRAALRAVLRTRTHVVTAIEQALDDGRLPTRRELRAWQSIGSDVQLGFASLLVPPNAALDTSTLRLQAQDERSALASVASAMNASGDPDELRVAELRSIRAEFPGRRILVFSEYATTIRAFFQQLRADAGIGMLTASEARIASGRLRREELLARFAPNAQESRAFPPHQAVTLLLATDLLSEGVNLQDATIVVHLDLPWNPARLAQRVGRVRRPGREAAAIRTFLIAPPVSSRSLLDLENRLRHKLELTRTAIGSGFAVLPAHGDASDTAPLGAASQLGSVAQALGRWHTRSDRLQSADVSTAAVKSVSAGWLAATSDGRLVACLDGIISCEPSDILDAVRQCDGPAPDGIAAMCTARTEACAWLEREQLAELTGLGARVTVFTRILARAVTGAVNSCKRHEQAQVVRHASQLRKITASPLPVGLEASLLEVIARTDSAPDVAAMLAVAHASQVSRRRHAPAVTADRIVALIELVR